jgi:diaminohydroxyphosphoribosylaminopyrimidine deaminase/5-amino-6-(5-phosphoribosylamino)uracil reductase
MRRALRLARRAQGTTSPNPAVGAVLVKDGEIVGEGHTQPSGQEHAEVVALRQAGERASGSILYVSLEPCSHHGRTPPCTDAIIHAGVREVRFATLDRNPQVAGSGMRALESAGITVAVGEEEEAAVRLNEAFFKWATTGLPYVTAKFAASLDGKIATRTGDSRWITGDAARRRAHRLRAISDAVIVGVGTVLADDPQLTARNRADRPLRRQPLRIVVDSQGRTPASARLLQEQGQVLVAGANVSQERKEALERAGAEVVDLPAGDATVDLKALLALLGQRDVTSVMVEGGSALLGSLFDQRLVDKVAAFIAPVIIGGASATAAVGGEGVDTIAQALRLCEVRTTRLGTDLMVEGYTGPVQ